MHWKYDIIENGYNYRLSDINCALGFSQLSKINFFLKKRKKIYEKYSNELKTFNLNLIIPKYSSDIKSSFHLFIINILFHKLKKNKRSLYEIFIAKKSYCTTALHSNL